MALQITKMIHQNRKRVTIQSFTKFHRLFIFPVFEIVIILYCIHKGTSVLMDLFKIIILKLKMILSL